ncbi:hypothetical protein DH2020_001871 [Rehmannia glutinosa]|uniref:Uncharacterized protein n=1 Tax=Rehmannia glutinosa TaxID=99300 RepID=A0ABR0XSI9_REHGL
MSCLNLPSLEENVVTDKPTFNKATMTRRDNKRKEDREHVVQNFGDDFISHITEASRSEIIPSRGITNLRNKNNSGRSVTLRKRVTLKEFKDNFHNIKMNNIPTSLEKVGKKIIGARKLYRTYGKKQHF